MGFKCHLCPNTERLSAEEKPQSAGKTGVDGDCLRHFCADGKTGHLKKWMEVNPGDKSFEELVELLPPELLSSTRSKRTTQHVSGQKQKMLKAACKLARDAASAAILKAHAPGTSDRAPADTEVPRFVPLEPKDLGRQIAAAADATAK